MNFKSRKGVVFTVISIIVSAIVITSFFALYERSASTDTENARLKIKSSNNYVSQVDNYIKDILLISGDVALNFMINEMISSNAFYSSPSGFDEQFQNCLINGEMILPPGGAFGLSIPCPNDANLTSKILDLNSFVNENLNLHSEITIDNISLSQNNPWNIIVTANITVNVTDAYASWYLQKEISQSISILGRSDPTYSINSNLGKYSLRITRPEYGGVWFERPSSLHQVVSAGQYFPYSGAPSYLDRLRNVSTSSFYGIVSIVPTSLGGEIPSGSSSLDFMYWKGITCDPTTNGGRYYLLDFSSLSSSNKLLLGISDNDHGINGTILPADLLITTNMSDPGGMGYRSDVLIPNC